jgi:hypothetical protein
VSGFSAQLKQSLILGQVSQGCFFSMVYTSLQWVNDTLGAAIVLGDDGHTLMYQRETALPLMVKGAVGGFTVEAELQQIVDILFHVYVPPKVFVP